MKEHCTCEGSHVGAVGEIREKMATAEEYAELANLYKMFGDPTRVKILHVLEGGEMCTCHIAEVLSMTKSAVSHQLSSLKMANLVKCRRDGQNVYYSLADEHVSAILDIGFEHSRE